MSKVTKLVKIHEDPNNPTYYYKDGKKDAVFQVKKRIGSESVRGSVFKVCKKGEKQCSALKVIAVPLQYETLPGANSCPENRIQREIKFLILCNELLKAGITNNLPRTCTFYDATDKSCYLTGSENTGKCVLFQAPLADGDMNFWIKSPKTENQIQSCILQVLLGIYVFRNQLGAFHRDLHLGNVLYYKERCKTYYYKVQGKIIAVPNFGFRFSLWDFDQSFSFLMCPQYKGLNSSEPLSESTDYSRFLDVLCYFLKRQNKKTLANEIDTIRYDYGVSNNTSVEDMIFEFITAYNVGKIVSKAPVGAKVYHLDKKLKLQ